MFKIYDLTLLGETTEYDKQSKHNVKVTWSEGKIEYELPPEPPKPVPSGGTKVPG